MKRQSRSHLNPRKDPPPIPHPPRTPGFKAAFHIKVSTQLPWRKAIGAAVATGIVMAMGLIWGHLVWGVWAFMGAFTSIYVTPIPYPQRARRLLGVAIGLALAFAAGSLTSGSWWLLAVALGLVGALSTFLASVFELPPPGGFMFVLIACIAAALPVDPKATPLRVTFVLLGGAIAWLVGMVGWPLHPHRPETLALASAYRSIANYLKSIGTPQNVAAQHAAALALEAAEDSVLQGDHQSQKRSQSYRLLQLSHQAQELFRASVALSSEVTEPLDSHWSQIVSDVADRVQHFATTEPLPPIEDSKESGPVWSRFHRTLSRTRDVLEERPHFVEETSFLELPGAWSKIRQGLNPQSIILPSVWRIWVALTVATLISRAIGNAHPYWVPLTVAAVLQGTSAAVVAQRSVQRAVGTTLGLLVVGLILLWHPTPTVTLALMMILQFLMLVLIVRNYGISVVFITALALVIITAEIHPPVIPLLLARFLDTVIGVTIGILAVVFLWGRAASMRAPSAIAATLRQEGVLLETLLQRDPKQIATARTRLGTKLLNLRTIYDTGLNEMPRPAHVEVLWPAVVFTQRIGYLLMAACNRQTNPGAQQDAPQWQRVFEALATRVEQETREPDIPKIPDTHPFNGVRQEVQALFQALEPIRPS